ESPASVADLLLPEHDLNPARPDGELGRLMLVLVGRSGLASGDVARPVTQVKPVDLALNAPTADASGRFQAVPAVVGKVAGQFEDFLDRLMSVETMAPRIETELLDVPQLVQTTTFGGIVHGVIRLSLSWAKFKRLHQLREYGL